MSWLKDEMKAMDNDFGSYIQTIGVRVVLYIIAVVLGGLWVFYYSNAIYCLIIDNVKYLNDNAIFASAVAIFMLTLPVVTFNWWLKNHDQLQQFKDTRKQQEQNFEQIRLTKQQQEQNSEQISLTKQQQTETLFSNAVQLLFKQEDIQANSVGLKELIRLRQETEDQKLIKRIDLITSSGLQLEKANLQDANLRGAKLQKVNLQGAKLKGAIWNDQTTFPTWLTPAERDRLEMKYQAGSIAKPNNH